MFLYFYIILPEFESSHVLGAIIFCAFYRRSGICKIWSVHIRSPRFTYIISRLALHGGWLGLLLIDVVRNRMLVNTWNWLKLKENEMDTCEVAVGHPHKENETKPITAKRSSTFSALSSPLSFPCVLSSLRPLSEQVRWQPSAAYSGQPSSSNSWCQMFIATAKIDILFIRS